MSATKEQYYRGVRMAPYDLVRELLLALIAVTVLVVLLAAFLSSPDEPPLTLKSVATQTPQIFVQTALDELDGNSPIAGYGPPYNNGSGSVQYIGPVSLQKLFGVHIPIDTAPTYVLNPLKEASATDPSLKSNLAAFNMASAAQKTSWENSFQAALNKATTVGRELRIPTCSSCGPVAAMMRSELDLGRSGSMDGLLLTSGHFYETDYTKPLLFMQNDAVANHAAKFNLLGSTWGAMNETGNYPGQAWLWLYTMLYQIPPYTTAWAANTDVLAILTVTILTLFLLLIPWIPGLNRLPRYLGVYRLIWKDYYREQRERARPVDVRVEGESVR